MNIVLNKAYKTNNFFKWCSNCKHGSINGNYCFNRKIKWSQCIYAKMKYWKPNIKITEARFE